MSTAAKNLWAKIAVTAWIFFLFLVAIGFFALALVFDTNAWFQLHGDEKLSAIINNELRVVLFIIGTSLLGGIVFIIRDFYTSVKNASVYDQARADYLAGMMGIGEFQKIVTLKIYVGRFNHTWLFWFFLQPLLSGLLGAIAYAIARSGLASLMGVGTEGDFSVRSLYMYAIFSFLAGFSSHKFITWLDRLADRILSASPDILKSETRQAVTAVASQDRAELRDTVVTSHSDSVSSEAEVDASVALTPAKNAKAAPTVAVVDPETSGLKAIR